MPEEEQGALHKNPIEVHNLEGDALVIDSRGGRIIKLELGGIPILTSVKRGDGKSANTHPCTPIFGPDEKDLYGLKQHGSMRNSDDCEAIKTDDGEGVIIRYVIKDAPGRYPSGVTVEQRLSVKKGVFKCETTHRNNGVEPAAINFAEHLYWNAPEGYKGTLVNDEDVTDDIAGNKIKILKAINVVQIPGCPKIILAQEGLPYANYWVGRYTDGKEDPDGKPDTGYLCIEPVENDPNKPFNSPENMLQPGDSRPATFTISLEKVAA